MALSDEVASRVLGELHQLTKHIDKQAKQIDAASLVVNQAAERIKRNSDDAVAHARESSLHAQLEGEAHIQVALTKAVTTTLNSVADAVAVKSAFKWAITGVLLFVAFTSATGFICYSKGKEVALITGWPDTPDGKLALQLSEAGSLEALATCDPRRGWKLANDVCHPQTTPEGIYGWRVKR